MKKALAFILALALAAPVAASTVQATPTPGPWRTRVPLRHNDWLSARRALDAAKLFLAKAPNDSNGERAKAQMAVDQALAAVNAAVTELGLK